jgi:hypothetical protein
LEYKAVTSGYFEWYGRTAQNLYACGDNASTTEQSVASIADESGTITTEPSTSSVVGSPNLKIYDFRSGRMSQK